MIQEQWRILQVGCRGIVVALTGLYVFHRRRAVPAEIVPIRDGNIAVSNENRGESGYNDGRRARKRLLYGQLPLQEFLYKRGRPLTRRISPLYTIRYFLLEFFKT